MYKEHRLEIFSCRASKDFASKMVEEYNSITPEEDRIALGNLEIAQFSDGEFQPYFGDSVRGASVFIVQSTCPPVDNLMELLLVIDAAKRASADEIVAVMPYFGWARQDRKDKPRTSIGAKLVADMLTAAGATRIMTCDLHADQEQGFFNFPVDHIYASKVFLPHIESLGLENLSIASPDMGSAKRANSYAKVLGCPVIICHKSREKANVVGSMTAIGEVEGRDVVIIDDMIDTAGTLCKAAEVLKEKGARSVRAYATHGVLSGKAIERIEASALEEVYITDSIPLKVQSNKIKVISLAGTFARIMKKIYNYEAISTEFVQ